MTSYVEGTGYERIYVRHNMVMAILWEDLETRPGGGWWFSFCTHSWNRAFAMAMDRRNGMGHSGLDVRRTGGEGGFTIRSIQPDGYM